jgi:NADH-quinone oxidoreductase subunit J
MIGETVQALFFYVFAFVTFVAAARVITARNPVHAVLFLILTFVSSAGIFLLAGAEFLAMMLVIVYVGAVMVLFLFVVMMLDVNFAELRAGYAKYLPVGGVIGLLLFAELAMVAVGWTPAKDTATRVATKIPDTFLKSAPAGADYSNTKALGEVLYTQYMFFFELAGIILLIAMIGAIVLTLQHKVKVKRQNIGVQVARDPRTAIEVKQVETGKGIL